MASHPPFKDSAVLETSLHGSSSSSRKSKKSKRKRKRDFEDSEDGKSGREDRSRSRSISRSVSRHHRRHGEEVVARNHDSPAPKGLRSSIGYSSSAASAHSYITADVFHQSMDALFQKFNGKGYPWCVVSMTHVNMVDQSINRIRLVV